MNDTELLHAYLRTTWTVDLPAGRVEIRLDRSVPADLPRPLGIITAYNPASEAAFRTRNEAANLRLREALQRGGAHSFPAMAGGTGPDADRWTEPGFAVTGMPRAAAVALGGHFGQNAIAWIDSAGSAGIVVTRTGFCGCEPGTLIREPPAQAAHARSEPHVPRHRHRHSG